jgi:hypothetical protein
MPGVAEVGRHSRAQVVEQFYSEASVINTSRYGLAVHLKVRFV